ncbi:MAG: ABC transporter substrate-binding protein [Pseudomonadota bacterium]
MKTVALLCGGLLSLSAAALHAETASVSDAPATLQTALVETTDAYPAAGKGTVENPMAMLQQGMDKLLDYLKEHPDGVGLGKFLAAEISPAFDFPYMARAAAGPYGRHMTEAQQQRLVNKLEVMFLTAMAEKLSSYDGQDVVYLPARSNNSKRSTITALINNPGGYPGRIDFRVHLTAEGWKIFDVAAKGQSAVAFYRGYFRKAMRRQKSAGSRLGKL